MDLQCTGKFIKRQRKALGLTQAQLAEKLLVSEKTVSKWECGNGFPDVDLISPLCKELKITANELLSGKKIEDKDYQIEAEKMLVELSSKQEQNTKFLLTLEIVLGIFATAFLLGLVLVARLVQMVLWLRVVLIVAGFVAFIVAMHFCLLIEKDAGSYMCKNCQHKHIPTYRQVFWAVHIGRTRYIRCPKCGKKSWQKKVVK